MSSRNDGGPAYPQHGWSTDPETVARMAEKEGASLRDAFAMAALSRLAGMVAEEMGDQLADHTRKSVAQECYLLADAMLEARKKPPAT